MKNVMNEPAMFTVRGAGTFPMDMLRHDQCWPQGSTDAMACDNHLDWKPSEVREIRLVAMRRRNITVDRWRSFGWIVGTIVEAE